MVDIYYYNHVIIFKVPISILNIILRTISSYDYIVVYIKSSIVYNKQIQL